MKGHESQQSASLIASIAIVIANIITKERLKISYSSKEILADICFWKVEVITSDSKWPVRKVYSAVQLLANPRVKIKVKNMVNGYLGTIASKELEQLFPMQN